MSQLVSFSNLQSLGSISDNSQILIRLDNSLSGTAGFGRTSYKIFNNNLPLHTWGSSNSAHWENSYNTVTNLSATWITESEDALNSSAGGYSALDSGKKVLFGSEGQLTVSKELAVQDGEQPPLVQTLVQMDQIKFYKNGGVYTVGTQDPEGNNYSWTIPAEDGTFSSQNFVTYQTFVDSYSSLPTPDDDDLLSIIDVSDSTYNAIGSPKKITFAQFKSNQSTSVINTSGTTYLTETNYAPFEVVTVPNVTRVLPAACLGWEGFIMSDIDATVKLATLSSWRFEYDFDSNGRYVDGRPVISKRGGIIRYVVTSPNTYTLYGDFSVAKYGWHPTDSSNLIGVWQAGIGHNYSCVGAILETVATDPKISTVWGARWGNGAIFYTSVDYQTDLSTFGPKLTADSELSLINFVNPKVYSMSDGPTASMWKCSVTPGSAFTMYMLIRQAATPGIDLEFVRLGTPTNAASAFGMLGLAQGLVWEYDNSKRYFFMHDKSTVAYPTKPVSSTYELTGVPILLSVEIDSTGGGKVYSGNTLVSDGPTGTAAFSATKLEIVGGVNNNLNGFAVLNSVPANAAERTQRQNYFNSLFS